MKDLSFLLLLFLFISCQPEKVKVLDLSKNCDDKMQTMRSIANIEPDCADLSQFQCEIREFSPTLASDTKKNLEYCLDGSAHCVRYDHLIFDTSDQKQIDDLASADAFQKGGEYNRQEVRCWHQFKKSKSPASDSSNLKDALKAAYEICKQ